MHGGTYMKKYKAKCPICGTVNKNLYLDETGGWMECEHCENTTQFLEFVKIQKASCVKTECVALIKSVT